MLLQQQPFVVGPGFSPVPAKTVNQIVSGKFVDLSDLLSAFGLHSFHQEKPSSGRRYQLLVRSVCHFYAYSHFVLPSSLEGLDLLQITFSALSVSSVVVCGLPLTKLFASTRRRQESWIDRV